jgi:hypothetical protein
MYNPSVEKNLASYHRKYVEKEINNYDVFVYHEDDIIFKSSSLAAYLYETKKLHNLYKEKSMLYDHIIGFQRYRLIAQGIILVT